MTEDEKAIVRLKAHVERHKHREQAFFSTAGLKVLLDHYEVMEEALTEIAWMRPAGDLPKKIDSSWVERMEKVAVAALEGHFATHEQRYGVPEPTGEGGESDPDHRHGPVAENSSN